MGLSTEDEHTTYANPHYQRIGMITMTNEERRDKIRELQRRNKKSPEFLARMQYIRAHDFSVRTTDEPPGFVVVVTEKTLSEKRTTNEE